MAIDTQYNKNETLNRAIGLLLASKVITQMEFNKATKEKSYEGICSLLEEKTKQYLEGERN